MPPDEFIYYSLTNTKQAAFCVMPFRLRLRGCERTILAVIRLAHDQVNPDCTGSTQFQPAPGAPVIEERIVLVDGGSQYYSVTVSPLPVMISTAAKRTSPR